MDKQELLRQMGTGTSRHWELMGTWGKWAPGNMSTRANRYLRQMGTLEHNGHLGTDRWTLGLVSIGENGHLGQMHTRKNEHQGKSAIGANGYFGTDGHCWDRGF